MKRLVPYLKPYWFALLVSSLLIILVAAIVGISPYVEGLVLTSLSESVLNDLPINYQYILTIIAILFGFYLTVGLSRFTFNWILTRTIQKAVKKLRTDIQLKIHRLPVSYFDTTLIGNTLGRMTTDVEGISNGIQQAFSSIISAFSQLVFIVLVMFWVNVQLAVIACLIIPVSLVISTLVLKKSQGIFNERYEAYGKFTGYIQEKYTGYKEISLYNKQEDLIKEFGEQNGNLSELVFRSNFLSGLLMPILTGLTYAIMVAVVFVGANLTFSGFIAIGAFQAFIKYVWRIGNPISQLTQMSVLLQSTSASAKRVFDFLDEKEEELDPEESKSLTHVKGEVRFENVTFGYKKDKKILKNISFTAKPGQMIAIVGPTGSGKTTLINLLMRFYDVNEGKILVDGINILEMKKEELREIFGMVLQDTWLFKGTIHENIKYSNENTADSDVILAAKEANVDHFIRTQPHGYQTLISEEADNISQGEKQLITIARALLANPNILILDEATSTVDTRVELILQEAMRRLLQNRTSFVIAHRLSTIKNADVILVLRDGEIIESGNHVDLISKQGFYYQLYQSQFQED